MDHRELDLTDPLRRHFGHDAFRPGQERLIRAVLAGRDALGVLPTGGGKSVCYMLPAALLSGLTVVVSPLVSLMEDQVVRAVRAGIPAAALNASMPAERRRGVLDDLRERRLRLLLVAPERFGVAAFRRVLEGVPVSLLAVDEAHCIDQWGYDFRPSYLALGGVRASVAAPCMALTATATPAVRETIVRVLGLRAPARVVGSFDRPNLRWDVVRVGDEGERRAAAVGLLRRLVRDGSGTAVVYVDTRREAEVLRDDLARLGLPVDAYHAGMRAAARARVQEDFMGGRRPVVVATNAFGMGVDKPDVRLVLHRVISGSLEAYYQEAGRAGRDGDPARCVVLHARGDGRLQKAFLDRSRPSVRVLRRLRAELVRTLGEGGRGDVDLRDVARALGRGWSPERAEAGVRALAGAGLLRLGDPAHPAGAEKGAAAGAAGKRSWEEPVPGEEGRPTVAVSLRPGRPDFGRAARLRRAGLERLDAVRRYAEKRTCRRRALLAYFGERAGPGACGGCDVCDPVLFAHPPPN